MGKELLAKDQIAKLKKLTELEVTELTDSMVDEAPSAIPESKGSGGITVGSSQKKMICDN